MFKSLCAQTPERKIRIGWLSFQPDKSISFGLTDKTFISPKFKARRFLWNAYNRVTSEYIVESDENALEPVKNPHFTYHPRAWLHLTSGPQGPKKARLFEAIADIPLALKQDGFMPWIRATSAPLAGLPIGSLRKNHKPKQDLIAQIPNEAFSARMAIDFVQPNGSWGQESASKWRFEWGDVGISVEVSFTHPQISTLSWFHSA